jgi:hypothetical protein
MQTDAAALAVTFSDRGSSSDDSGAEPPDTSERSPSEPSSEPPSEPPRESRRRWWNRVPGGAFLDGPADDRYSNLWLGACGQGG